MSRVYDNWERLVAAVVRREEIWELCHAESVASDFSSSTSLSLRNPEEYSSDAHRILGLKEKQYKQGVYITLVSLSNGTRFVKRVRFSRLGFEEKQQSVIWWYNNREKIFKKYNAWGGIVTFSSTPTLDHQHFLGPTSVDENGSCLAESDDDHWSVKSERSKDSANAEKSIEGSDVLEDENIYLQELKQLIEVGLNRHEFITSSKQGAEVAQEVFIWGVKLLEDERSDVLLLKFLRAKELNVSDAFSMIKNTIQWRKENRVEEILEEDVGWSFELERVFFMHGYSKEGHPVYYNVYGEFDQDKWLYHQMFSDEGKRQKLLRWIIQFFEKAMRKMDFTPGGISTIVVVSDLKNSSVTGKREFRQVFEQANQLLQDNYPGFVAKQIIINAPWRMITYNKIISPLLAQATTRSKIAFAGPSSSMGSLFKFASAEEIPLQYQGLASDWVTEIVVEPSSLHIEEFPLNQLNINVPWWNLALSKVGNPFLTQRTKSKFVFAGPSKSTETLFKYVSAEQVPKRYGGLSEGGDSGVDDCVCEIIVRPVSKHTVEFDVNQVCIVSWEARVVGWQVAYGVEFVPGAENSYTTIVDKIRRIRSSEEKVMCGSFKVDEPGKLVLFIDNLTSKKKKLLYRFKTKLYNINRERFDGERNFNFNIF